MRKPVLTLAIGLVAGVFAQGPLSLSLQQTLDLAAQQSYAVRSSALEAQKSDARSKEITAIGFPQLSGKVELQNFIDVPAPADPITTHFSTSCIDVSGS